ncbi:MAG: DUF3168 domain-containing protein [Propionivibrio sp.]
MKLFPLVKAGTDLLGTNPTRFFEFGRAPQLEKLPYATWQILSGEPVNFMSGPPTDEIVEAQIDIWAETAVECRTVARAVRRALDPFIQISHYFCGWDEESQLFRTVIRCTFQQEI